MTYSTHVCGNKSTFLSDDRRGPAVCEANEKRIYQLEVWPLPQSAHSIQRKWRREKMQIEFYQVIISCNLLLVILL